MSTSAVIMMLVAMIIIWGGLCMAILNLRRSDRLPETSEIHRDL